MSVDADGTMQPQCTHPFVEILSSELSTIVTNSCGAVRNAHVNSEKEGQATDPRSSKLRKEDVFVLSSTASRGSVRCFAGRSVPRRSALLRLQAFRHTRARGFAGQWFFYFTQAEDMG